MAYTRNKAINGDVSIGGRYFANYGSAGIASPAVHASQIDEFNEGIALEVAKANSAARNAIRSIAGSSFTAGKGLVVGTESKLEVKAAAPLSFTEDGELTVKLGTGLINDNSILYVELGSGLARYNDTNKLTISAGGGLSCDTNGRLQIRTSGQGLQVNAAGYLSAYLGDGLDFRDGGRISVVTDYIENCISAISSETINALT